MDCGCASRSLFQNPYNRRYPERGAVAVCFSTPLRISRAKLKRKRPEAWSDVRGKENKPSNRSIEMGASSNICTAWDPRVNGAIQLQRIRLWRRQAMIYDRRRLYLEFLDRLNSEHRRSACILLGSVSVPTRSFYERGLTSVAKKPRRRPSGAINRMPWQGWVGFRQLPISENLARKLIDQDILVSAVIQEPGCKRGRRLISTESFDR